MATKFRAEHAAKLQSLFLTIAFEARKLQGSFGANYYTAYQLLHETSLKTLRSLRNDLKKQLNALSEADEWSDDDKIAKRVIQTNEWYDFVHLLVGYKTYLEEQDELNTKIAEKQADLNRLINENKTPAERIAELQAEIALMKA